MHKLAHTDQTLSCWPLVWNIYSFFFLSLFRSANCLCLPTVCLSDFNYDCNSTLFMHTDRGGWEKQHKYIKKRKRGGDEKCVIFTYRYAITPSKIYNKKTGTFITCLYELTYVSLWHDYFPVISVPFDPAALKTKSSVHLESGHML